MLLSFVALVAGANYALNKKWPWENEEGHEWDIDVTPIMKELHPEDKSRYYIKPGKQFREVLRYFENPVHIIGAKFSPAVHTVLEQFTGHQAGSGWTMPWADEDMSFYESIPERLKAVVEKFVPFSLRGNNFAFAFPMSKGMTPWKALRAYEDLIKTDVDPNFLQRVLPKDVKAAKARLDDACELNDLDPEKMFKQSLAKVRGEYYSDLWYAIEKQDYEKADRAAKVLLKLGVTSKGIKRSAESRDRSPEEIEKAWEIYDKQAN
jgi:hypothetical protein